MEFISANEFLRQNKKVQEVFLQWWEPSDGDIYWWIEDKHIDCCYNWKFIDNIEVDNLKGNEITPLLTEGQLRKFIEDKTNGIVKLIQWNPIIDNEKHGYDIHILAKDQYKVLCTFNYKTLGTDLLQAYWKVAIQIAEQL